MTRYLDRPSSSRQELASCFDAAQLHSQVRSLRQSRPQPLPSGGIATLSDDRPFPGSITRYAPLRSPRKYVVDAAPPRGFLQGCEHSLLNYDQHQSPLGRKLQCFRRTLHVCVNVSASGLSVSVAKSGQNATIANRGAIGRVLQAITCPRIAEPTQALVATPRGRRACGKVSRRFQTLPQFYHDQFAEPHLRMGRPAKIALWDKVLREFFAADS